MTLQVKTWYFAGLVTYPDRSRHIVAAGGYELDDTLTYIYDLDLGIGMWRPGPDLPFLNGASVPYGDTFLVVGGEQNYFPYYDSDLISEFNPDPSAERWNLRPERLKSSKLYMTAFLVPDDYATC